ISVGMQVNIKVLTTGPMALIVAGALIFVSISGKGLAALFAQKLFKFSKGQGGLIYGLSGSHAAATLAVILVGYNAKILDEAILNGTIILILTSCIISSVVTERSAKAILIQNETESEKKDDDEITNKENIIVSASKAIKFEKLLELAIL